MKKQIFYVGVISDEKFLFAPYGFTNYGDCYVEAETSKEAGETAKHHFEEKYKVRVCRTRAMFANPRFHNPEGVIKPVQKLVQLCIFDDLAPDPAKPNTHRKRIKRVYNEDPVLSLVGLLIVWINRIFSKLKNFYNLYERIRIF